jgi:hypothetical protein
MATVSVSVSDGLKRRMTALRFVNWSSVARDAFGEKVGQLETLYKITDKSKLKEGDSIDIGRKVNKAAAKRLAEAMKGDG